MIRNNDKSICPAAVQVLVLRPLHCAFSGFLESINGHFTTSPSALFCGMSVRVRPQTTVWRAYHRSRGRQLRSGLNRLFAFGYALVRLSISSAVFPPQSPKSPCFCPYRASGFRTVFRLSHASLRTGQVGRTFAFRVIPTTTARRRTSNGTLVRWYYEPFSVDGPNHPRYSTRCSVKTYVYRLALRTRWPHGHSAALIFIADVRNTQLLHSRLVPHGLTEMLFRDYILFSTPSTFFSERPVEFNPEVIRIEGVSFNVYKKH